MINEKPMNENQDFVAGALPYQYIEVDGTDVTTIAGGVIDERYLSIYVNGAELATMMCSPLDHEALALGFVYNEGVINSLADVGYLKRNVSGSVVDVFLNHSDFSPPRRLIITSGCSGGITTQDLTATYPPLETDFATTPTVLQERMRDLQGAARLYNLVRGVHAAILASTDELLVSAEDVGRHNAVDKVTGKALQAGIDTRDKLLLTSGRISSEMLSKARRMGIPIVASRTAPTSMTVQMAQVWNICVVGYLRRGSLRVYTHPQRLGLEVKGKAGER
jgi:FdhD protein